MLENLKRNFERLIALYESQKKENEILRSDFQSVKEENETLHKQIAELKKQIGNLELTGAFSASGAGSGDAEARIDKLIKEIDKCISLLEK